MNTPTIKGMDRLAYYREYNAKRKEKMKEYDKARQAEKAEYLRKDRAENPERYAEYQRRNIEKNSQNWACNNNKIYKMWWAARKRANASKIPFDIEQDDVKIPNSCPCCDGEMTRPSLDKVKPHLGYTKGNVAVICFDCNVIKSFGDAARHRQIADFIDNFS